MSIANIKTRYAIVKRMEKMVGDIDGIFEDGGAFGLSNDEIDPNGVLLKIRKSLVASLENEGRIKTMWGSAK